MALPNARSSSIRWPAASRGQATDIEIQAREVISLKRRLEEIFAKHTEQSLDKVSKDMERDYFMTPESPGIQDHRPCRGASGRQGR